KATQRIVDGVHHRCRRCDGAPFSHSLDAETRVGRWRLDVQDTNVRHLSSPGEHVIEERRGKRLAIGIVADLLVQRRSDSLRNAADDLPLDDQRIYHGAAVVAYHIVEQLDGADPGIYRDHTGMAGVGERSGAQLRLIHRIGFEPRRLAHWQAL